MIGGAMFGRWQVSHLQFLILLQLMKGPRYGYELLKDLREQFSGVWEPKTGTIYPALRRLEARGFVKTERKEEMDFYELNGGGEELLKQIGEKLESDLKFAHRYFMFAIQLMPSFIKYRMLNMMRVLAAEEDVMPPILIENFLEDVNVTTKLEVLESIKANLNNRLEVVERMIEASKSDERS
jgi:DNA-binding PadR family transcriptional regulator